MFKNTEHKETNIKEVETIIGQSVKVKGNFHGQGNIVVEGSVEGSIKTKSFLLVGEKAKITADISAKNARISGEVVGNVRVSGYLEINSTAKVIGNLDVEQISIEKGAIVNGHCQMGKPAPELKK